ncbi:hypothetical protein FRX31_005338 [Thalictrum thalictroides]|uniref:RING-type domain-containing protein n=1 Tax=Thalictrum thalictroides TaxID=46969 RepID=A0A7J6X891_THATH|nr:hypothetical protein FRX31_005338 [Thalictrum thalictroides]
MLALFSPPALSPAAPHPHHHHSDKSSNILLMYVYFYVCFMIVFGSVLFSVRSKLIDDEKQRRRQQAVAGHISQIPIQPLQNSQQQRYPSSSLSNDINVHAARNVPLTYIIDLPSNCAICLMELREEVQLEAVASCHHVFHGRCINQWRNCNPRQTCPLCRAAI